MPAIPSEEAREDLDGLIAQVHSSHVPVEIHGGAGTAVLLAAEDWRAIQETLYLISIPGMRESIREGMATPLEDCAREPGW